MISASVFNKLKGLNLRIKIQKWIHVETQQIQINKLSSLILHRRLSGVLFWGERIDNNKRRRAETEIEDDEIETKRG